MRWLKPLEAKSEAAERPIPGPEPMRRKAPVGDMFVGLSELSWIRLEVKEDVVCYSDVWLILEILYPV